MTIIRVFPVLSLFFLAVTVPADESTLDAVKDSGYFAAVDEDTGEVFPTPNNFGSHIHVPVGSANNLRLNRSVFEFDLSSIPTDAKIESVRFDFEVTLQGGPNGQAAVDFGLYRVTSLWDEGTGTSNIGEATGDGVTWSMRTAVDPWTTLGGDFDPAVLGTDFVDGPGNYSISTAALLSAVQDMIDGTTPNNGFLLKAEPEGLAGSAARVSTREGGNAVKLVVTFNTGKCLLGDANQDGAVNLLDVTPFVSLLVGGGFSCEADANEDGVLDLLDVGPFIAIINGG